MNDLEKFYLHLLEVNVLINILLLKIYTWIRKVIHCTTNDDKVEDIVLKIKMLH